MSIELLIALIGLATAVVTLLAALTPYIGSLSSFVQKIIGKESASRKPLRNHSRPNRNWFVNTGETKGHIMWEDCVQYGCIGAGGGVQYAEALQRLKLGDTVYSYISGHGYVGCGTVSQKAVPIS